MSKGRSHSIKSVLAAAKRKEKSYKWLEAAKLYEQALGTVGKGEFAKIVEIQGWLGYSFYRAAFQAETQREVRRLIGLSAEAYDGAAELLEALGGLNKQARVSLCLAKAAYSRSWLAEDSTKRAALLDECRTYGKDAVKAYADMGNNASQGHACNELLTCLHDRRPLAQDAKELKNILEEALAYGEQAIHALVETEDERALARAYYQLSWGCISARYVHESLEKQKTQLEQALSYAEKAVEVAERTGDQYLIGRSDLVLNEARWFVNADAEAGLRQHEKTFERATMTRDRLLIAWVREAQAAHRHFNALTVEDPDKRREEYTKVIQNAEDAIASMELLAYPWIWAYYRLLSSYFSLAELETDLAKKRGLLTKAVELAEEYLPKVHRSGSHSLSVCVMHPFSSVLDQLATIETKTGEKRRLLTQAAEYGEAAANAWDCVQPFDYWGRAMYRGRLGLTKAELAKLEPDRQKKKDLLTAAAMTVDEALNLIKKHLRKSFAVSHSHTAHVGGVSDVYGNVLNQLYLLTGEETYLKRAIKRCEDAVEAWKKADIQGRLAETHWQMAKFYDHLGGHLKAARAFAAAAKVYTQAAAKLPQLKTFYTDYGVYMQAWSEIEAARHHHAGKRYDRAKDHYERAAALHRKTERWDYLNANYLAWARLEEAECLSRGEGTEDAKGLFQQGANLFAEAKKLMQAKLGSLEAGDERAMVAELVKVSDVRREYCLGRMALEGAKILDRQGDQASSSRQYGAAAERFQQALNALERPRDRQELQPILYLTRAWQMMTRAEAEVSPAFYLEAAKLFEEAKKHSVDEKTKFLAVGHSRFCRALEAGARFEATRDMALYPAAKRHLEAAVGFYLKSGFKPAVQYAIATRRLFDAYLHMTEAETETDPGRKALCYEMAERMLQASAGSFVKAKHPEKEKQLHRLLKGVKEERQLVLSLTKLVHAPAIAASTTTFSTPSPTHETATGLERFEHACIRAHVSAPKEFVPGEGFEIKLDLANAGTKPGLLVRIEGVVPSRCEVLSVPSYCALEGASLNMRGRRLKPLCVESVSIRVHIPDVAGVSLSPQVVYVDELGNFRTTKLEEVKILPVVEFESEVAQGIFNYLVEAFVEDCVKRRLGFEKAGWRSFPQIIKRAGVSKRSLYGSSGRLGHALSELQRKRMVDLKTFLGERGRGGHILKVRIHHKKELVKRYVKEKAPNLLI